MVRLKDIALRAGVSVMTVSKALRDARDISAATKARLQALAAEMNYVPDVLAQSLRTRRTQLFGLVIPAVTSPLMARMVMAIEEWSHQHGYDVLLSHSHNDPAREELALRRMLARRVDGVFISPAYRPELTAPAYDELRKRNVPTIILGPSAPFCAGFANVETNDLDASQNLTRHLIELGHRRIAFLAGPRVSPWAQERLEGYRRALREARIEFDDRLLFQSGATIEEGGTAALQLLNESCAVTAVQAVNDLVAVGAATVLQNQGLHIPRDLSIVGFGNVLLSEHFRVPLTTARQPKFRLGVAAMESMMKLVRGENPGSKRLPVELIFRQSTAAPKQ